MIGTATRRHISTALVISMMRKVIIGLLTCRQMDIFVSSLLSQPCSDEHYSIRSCSSAITIHQIDFLISVLLMAHYFWVASIVYVYIFTLGETYIHMSRYILSARVRKRYEFE